VTLTGINKKYPNIQVSPIIETMLTPFNNLSLRDRFLAVDLILKNIGNNTAV